MSETATANVTVPGANGLHLGPCSIIAQSVSALDCEIRIEKGDLTVNAKNIFELVSLIAGEGTKLTVTANGDEAEMAIQTLVELFKSGFNGYVAQAAE